MAPVTTSMRWSCVNEVDSGHSHPILNAGDGREEDIFDGEKRVEMAFWG